MLFRSRSGASFGGTLTANSADPFVTLQGNQLSGVHYAGFQVRNQPGTLLTSLQASYIGGVAHTYLDANNNGGNLVLQTQGNDKVELLSSGRVNVYDDLQILSANDPFLKLNTDPADATDSDRAFLGIATAAGNFVGGSVAGDTVLRARHTEAGARMIFAHGTGLRAGEYNSTGDWTFAGGGSFGSNVDITGELKTGGATAAAALSVKNVYDVTADSDKAGILVEGTGGYQWLMGGGVANHSNSYWSLRSVTNNRYDMVVTDAGRFRFGGPVVYTTHASSASAFAGNQPFAKFETGTSQGTYADFVELRHAAVDATAVNRSLGIRFNMSSEGSAGESGKSGEIYMRSGNSYANAPNMHIMSRASGSKVNIGTEGNTRLEVGTTEINALVGLNMGFNDLYDVGTVTSSAGTGSSSASYRSFASDQEYIMQTYNASAGNAAQFNIRHAYGSVILENERGHIEFASTINLLANNVTGVDKLTVDTINAANLPEYADDAAAGVGGLVEGDIYKTSTGELRIKLA